MSEPEPKGLFLSSRERALIFTFLLFFFLFLDFQLVVASLRFFSLSLSPPKSTRRSEDRESEKSVLKNVRQKKVNGKMYQQAHLERANESGRTHQQIFKKLVLKNCVRVNI